MKAVVADSVARAAASHTGVVAARPILMIGQVRPNRTMVAASCSQAIRGTRLCHPDRGA